MEQDQDIYFMQLAIEEAKKGRGNTGSTNWSSYSVKW